MNGPTITVPQALEIAQAHLRQGQLLLAEAMGRQVLAAAPEQCDALHLLALVAHQSGADAAAEDYARRAIAARPGSAPLHESLGCILARRGRAAEAVASLRTALQLAPDLATAHFHLGIVLEGLAAPAEALAAYREALRLAPTAAAHNNLGNLLGAAGDLPGALAAYRAALQLDPRDPLAHHNLGHTLLATGDPEGALRACRAALALAPEYANAHLTLGNAHASQGQFAAAIAAYHTALACDPTLADARGNLGNALKDSGRIEEALPHYREALRLAPDRPLLHSNLVYSLECLADPDPTLLKAERARWNERHAAPLRAGRRPHENDRTPERRLKIGYVSPEFCTHAVAFFLLPLFRAHHRTEVEVHAYASVSRPDARTAQFRAAVDVWHDVLGLPDAELAEKIRRDRIDILVDLSQHAAFNRLPLFARQPAPVQVSWLAYPGGSGLETMDWRLTTAHFDPEAVDAASGEPPMFLPDTWCCYDPLDAFPAPLPRAPGPFLFGSLNQFNKISPAALECWARLLTAVPQARLAMICPAGPSRDRVRAIFARHAVAETRLDWLAPMPWHDYVRLGQRIDVGLDAFPYNGLTTTCHTLWMGRPVVTLAGPTPVSRSGLSLLSSIGHPELVAHCEEDYLHLATALAGDPARLAHYHATLREKMRASPLLDGPGFARKIEAAYRTMWQHWCG